MPGIQIKANLDLNKNYVLNGGWERLNTAPTNPTTNQLYVDSTNNVWMQWDGVQWVSLGGTGSMTFKGTVGTGGTVTALPTNVDEIKNGDTYEVCQDGTYAGQKAVIGDLFIAVKKTDTTPATVTWAYVPSGNDKFEGEIVGDGTSKDFTINHTLNSKGVQVELYDANTYETVLADITRVDETSIKVSFGIAPATTEKYKVIISY